MEINFRLNQNPTCVEAIGYERLSDILRDYLHQRGTKIGCDAGDCGACSVLIDGKIACACLTPISQMEGAEIETVEGLSDDNMLSILQKSFYPLWCVAMRDLHAWHVDEPRVNC